MSQPHPLTTYPVAGGAPARRLDMVYGEGVDAAIGRVTAVTEGPDVLESYSYLGVDQVMARERPLTGSGGKSLDLSYANGGLDALGRIAQQRWTLDQGPSSTDLENLKYWYDADGNLLAKLNLVHNWNSEVYHADGASSATAYDAFNRMTAYQRGIADTDGTGAMPTAIGSPEQVQQSWGNRTTTDWVNWARTGGTPSSDPATRPIVQGKVPDNTVTAGRAIASTTPMLFVQFDAWGQMSFANAATQVVYSQQKPPDPTQPPGSPPQYETHTDYQNVQAHSFRYDALGRRISDSGSELYYDGGGQVIEETSSAQLVQYVRSPVDESIILRDRDTDHNTATHYEGLPAGMDERLYPITDARGSITALVGVDGTVVERYLYTPDGQISISGNGQLPTDWRAQSQYQWKYLFEGGRDDGSTGVTGCRLYWMNGRELDSFSGGTLAPDPAGYFNRQLAYNLDRIECSNVTPSARVQTATTIFRFIGLAALAVATGGASVAAQGSLAVLRVGSLAAGEWALGGAIYGLGDAAIRGEDKLQGMLLGAQMGLGFGAAGGALAMVLPAKAMVYAAGGVMGATTAWGVYDALTSDLADYRRYSLAAWRAGWGLYAGLRLAGYELNLGGGYNPEADGSYVLGVGRLFRKAVPRQTAADRSSLLDRIVSDANRVAAMGGEVTEAQATALRQNLPVVQRRSASANEVVRAEFERNESFLISEWERNTGRTWPVEATPHHIVPLESGGANAWWNLMPTYGALPNHSLPGIPGPHAAQGTLRDSIQQGRRALPPGTITDLRTLL